MFVFYLSLFSQIFHANIDPAEVVLNRVPQPVLARFVRIRPQTWKNGIALRFELYGCQITGSIFQTSSAKSKSNCQCRPALYLYRKKIIWCTWVNISFALKKSALTTFNFLNHKRQDLTQALANIHIHLDSPPQSPCIS